MYRAAASAYRNSCAPQARINRSPSHLALRLDRLGASSFIPSYRRSSTAPLLPAAGVTRPFPAGCGKGPVTRRLCKRGEPPHGVFETAPSGAVVDQDVVSSRAGNKSAKLSVDGPKGTPFSSMVPLG